MIHRIADEAEAHTAQNDLQQKYSAVVQYHEVSQHTIFRKTITVTNIKLIPKQQIRIKLQSLQVYINSKNIKSA